MNIYRSRRDNQLYLLSWCSPPKYTGSWLESARYDWAKGQITQWKQVPAYKENDFVKVCEKLK